MKIKFNENYNYSMLQLKLLKLPSPVVSLVKSNFQQTIKSPILRVDTFFPK